jgi:hypothetical protein
MDNRKFEADAIGTAPVEPVSPSSGYPTNGDPTSGQNATEPGAYWFHAVGEEIRAVIAAGGLTPEIGTLNQMKLAIDALIAAAIPAAAPDASTAVKGLVELATDAEVQAGTDAVRAVTPAGLLSAVLGMGQSWQDVKASRAALTTYTNSTGKAIVVNVTVQVTSAPANAILTINGTIDVAGSNTTTTTNWASVLVVVPAGATYSLKTSLGSVSAIINWYELR